MEDVRVISYRTIELTYISEIKNAVILPTKNDYSLCYQSNAKNHLKGQIASFASLFRKSA